VPPPLTTHTPVPLAFFNLGTITKRKQRQPCKAHNWLSRGVADVSRSPDFHFSYFFKHELLNIRPR
jgi:hypothetical protein